MTNESQEMEMDINTRHSHFTEEKETHVSVHKSGLVVIQQFVDYTDEDGPIYEQVCFSAQRWDEVRNQIDNMILDIYNQSIARSKNGG